MTKLEFDYDFSYEAATGRPWEEVVQSIMDEVGQLAADRLRALASSRAYRTGRLAGSHVSRSGSLSVTVENTAAYAEFVKPKGSTGRWRYWTAREMRNAFEDVSLARFGDVEDALLMTIGPTPRTGSRATARSARIRGRSASSPTVGRTVQRTTFAQRNPRRR